MQRPLVMNKEYKYPILAKPSGITLDQHRKNVLKEGRVIVDKYPFVLQKYKNRVGKCLKTRLLYAIEFHDDGKEDERWQEACQADYQKFVDWQKNRGGDFSAYTSTNQNNVGQNLRKAGIRHEFQSLVIHKNNKLPTSLQAAIASHHGKLGFRYEDRWKREGVQEFWNVFRRESNRVIDESLSLKQVAQLHYEYAAPRGLLQLADHRASAIEDGDSVPPFTSFNYDFPHPEKRNVQKLVEDNWQDDLLLIRAATGAGKTDASLIWASKQIKGGRADRMVIAMPTRFTSNALAINVAESLSDTGLYHSSAWFNEFQEKVEAGEVSKKEATKEHEFARLLQTPVTVCTIDHLLISLTLTREDHHLIAFNLANSCLVIDEADFYDDFTQANILVLLEFLKYWNVPVLLMSASLPESVLPYYKGIGFNVSEIKEDKSDLQEFDRVRFEIKAIKDCEFPDDIDGILNRCLDMGAAIIYANTVDRAMAFLGWFERNGNGIKTCLYHSRFTEPDKARKEDMLLKMLGKDTWEKKQAHGVAILTQIGEMSINISADIMISDLCPIDRLTQRAGRLCRFDKSKKGELFVLIPKKNETVYPAPYGEYDRKAKSWIATEAFGETRQKIGCEPYSTKKLVSLLNEIYPQSQEFSSKATGNAKTLKEYFKVNWLINSIQLSSKDDTAVSFWKSRDIIAQDTIFVNYPPSRYFNNYLAYQNWKLKNSTDLPIYLIEKGKKNSMVDMVPIIIKDEEEQIYVVKKGFYGFEKGVNFTLEDSIL